MELEKQNPPPPSINHGATPSYTLSAIDTIPSSSFPNNREVMPSQSRVFNNKQRIVFIILGVFVFALGVVGYFVYEQIYRSPEAIILRAINKFAASESFRAKGEIVYTGPSHLLQNEKISTLSLKTDAQVDMTMKDKMRISGSIELTTGDLIGKSQFIVLDNNMYIHIDELSKNEIIGIPDQSFGRWIQFPLNLPNDISSVNRALVSGELLSDYVKYRPLIFLTKENKEGYTKIAFQSNEKGSREFMKSVLSRSKIYSDSEIISLTDIYSSLVCEGTIHVSKNDSIQYLTMILYSREKKESGAYELTFTNIQYDTNPVITPPDNPIDYRTLIAAFQNLSN